MKRASSALALALALGAAASAGASAPPARCPVPEGPVRARVALPGGGEAIARDGALELPGRVLTRCDGLPGAFPLALAVVGGRLAVGFRSAGLHVLDGARFSRVEGLPADAVRALVATDGTLWAGTGASGLWRWRPGTPPERLAHRVLGVREISALAVGARGELRVGAGMYGVWSVSASGAVRRLARGVYAGCFRRGGDRLVAEAPGRGCALGQARPASGLPSPHVTALAELEGRLVVGTFDRGLARLGDDGRFEAVSGSPAFINGLLADGPALWIATPKGLYRWQGEQPVRRVALPLPSEHVNGMAMAPDGTLWLATGEGLAGVGLDGSVRVLDERHGLPSHIAYSVAVTDDGAVWGGTAGGVARFGPDGVTRYSQAAGTLPHDWVNALFADGDQVLAGTYDAGVARLWPDGRGLADAELQRLWVNPGGLAYLGAGRLAVATLGDGLVVSDRAGRHAVGPLPSDDVTSALVVSGVLWVGTRGGLWARPEGGTQRTLIGRR